MRKAGETKAGQGIWRGILTLVLVLVIGLSADDLRIVSHAQSQGRVTATTSVNIRKEPNTTSDVLGAAEPGQTITITNQTTGGDGKIWYQTFVNAETLGYIRSDFVEIIDGSTPATVTPVTPTTPNTPNTTTAVGDVEALNPVSATVKGGSNVRIRSGASTSDSIVKKVANGLVLTVTGRATDSAGAVWYKVNFSDNGSEVEGFIRYDYLTITEELTPYVPEPEAPEPDTGEPEAPVEPEVTKEYDTEFSDGVWYLLDYGANTKTSIKEIYEKLSSSAANYQEEHKKAESQKVVIIILVFLLVAAISGIAMLVFKIRDMSDDAYFNRVEKETLRKRSEKKQSQGGSQRVMHTVGSEKPSRPVNGRTSGAQQGQRPQQSYPGGQQGQRPQGGQQSHSGGQQGQRPQGSQQSHSGGQQGQRPQGGQQSHSGGQQGQRPQGGQQSHSGGQQGQRPQGSQQGHSGGQQGQRPQGGQQGHSDNRQNPNSSDQKPQGWQSRNFMSEEDEFEFEFLNYDGNEQK